MANTRCCPKPFKNRTYNIIDLHKLRVSSYLSTSKTLYIKVTFVSRPFRVGGAATNKIEQKLPTFEDTSKFVGATSFWEVLPIADHGRTNLMIFSPFCTL